MGLIRKAATAVEDAPAVEAAQYIEEAKTPSQIDAQLNQEIAETIKARPALGSMPWDNMAFRAQIMAAVVTSPLIANLALTVPEDKRGELIEKYYDLAMRLIRK